MGGGFLIYIALLGAYIFYVFNLVPIELNLNISKINLTNSITTKGDSYIDFKNNTKEVKYKTLEVYDNSTETTKNVDGLLFTLKYNNPLFIPKKENLGNYTILNFNGKEGRIERIKNDFIYFPSNSIIGSFYYSGSTSSGDVINTIDNSIYCSFDNATFTCN